MVTISVAVSRLRRHSRSPVRLGYHLLKQTAVRESKVIFIAGQQRSGTKMLMDVPERHWSIDVYQETDDRAFDNYMMRDQATIRRLFEQSKAKHFVIEALCELQQLRHLLDGSPRTKAIRAIRHYDDVFNSIIQQFSSVPRC